MAQGFWAVETGWGQGYGMPGLTFQVFDDGSFGSGCEAVEIIKVAQVVEGCPWTVWELNVPLNQAEYSIASSDCEACTIVCQLL